MIAQQQRADLIERRAKMAATVLNLLLIAMDDDSPPVEGEISEAISAAIELLSVAEVVAQNTANV